MPTYRKRTRLVPRVVLTVFALAAGSSSALAQATGALPASALQQINELTAEKENRTPAQRKISSSLLYTAKMKRGVSITPSVRSLIPAVPVTDDGRVSVEIAGDVGKVLVEAIEQAGGQVAPSSIKAGVIRALVPLDQIEQLAAMQEVRAIHPAMSARTQIALVNPADRVTPKVLAALERAQTVGGRLQQSAVPAPMTNAGSVTSEGSKAHGAERARKFFGVNGAGVKIGVISDSDDFKEESIASGDLPADTVTVPGQSGRPGSGEGTAMMQIVHDVAPGAKLFFATAFNSPESFAENIRTLRFTYGCDIIVDDVIYYFESPYQDDIVARAVKDVIADGAQYFSSAGNQGNADDGSSGTWEGDFKLAKTGLAVLPSGYQVHDFGKGVISNRITVGGGPLYLHWSDPGSLDHPQSSNDYDLFLLDQDLRNVLVASTDIQDGTGLPFEFLDFNIPAELRVVVARKVGAADRALHLVLSSGAFGLATQGATYGHNAVEDALSVAAVNVAEAAGGEFTGGPFTPVETYSSDGNRRIFYNVDGTPLTPGNFLIKTDGGDVRKKPDLTAADGVVTTLPAASHLNPFFGTSAAAPHAAAIAGLLKSAKPAILPTRLRNGLTKSAIDIEAVGRDRDSGFGIVSAFGALEFINATPRVFLELGTVTATSPTGSPIVPGGTGKITTQLINNGGATAGLLTGKLSTLTPGVTVTTATSTFPPLDPGTSGVNNTPFAFSLASNAACGLAPTFNLRASFASPTSPTDFSFKVQTGRPATTPTVTPFAGSPVAIPDGNAAGVNIPLTVSGVGAISNLAFHIGGATCTTAVGATTVGVSHSWVGDLVMKLTSPGGTTVTLMSRPGGETNSANNFCQTILTDSAVNSIQTVAIAGAPYVGSFRPASPLSAFTGENADGTWILNVSDNVTVDTGAVRAFSLDFTGFDCTTATITTALTGGGSIPLKP
jgi:subtilisin-like proprotein convertase family protein